MKVLHICNNFISSTVHQKMVEHSRKIGIKNTVFAPVVTLEGRVQPGEDEYAVRCVNQVDRFFFFYKQRKTRRSLEKTVPVNAYDCLHTHCVFTDGNTALWIKQKTGIPYVVTINNTDLNHFFRLRILLRPRGVQILREAAHIVYISEPYHKAVINRYIPERYREELESKTSIIPFGIDDFWLNHCDQGKKALREKTLRLVFAGDICKNKNLDAIIAAMRILEGRGWTVSLIAAGKVLDSAVHERLLAEPTVNYVGLVSKESLLEYYRKSDIFVMPSFTDTFGLVYAEALSQGLPIIYSQGQGFDGQFQEGYVGYHVDPHSQTSVADAIERIASDYNRIQANCAEAALKFSWDTIARQYQKIYESIVLGERE